MNSKYPKAKIIYLTQSQFNFLAERNASAFVRTAIDSAMASASGPTPTQSKRPARNDGKK